MSILAWVCLGFLALVYGGSGLAELFTWRKSAPQFVDWGYPRWWAIVTPMVKLVAALLLIAEQTRIAGVLLCLAVGLAASATVLWHREKAMYLAALPVTLLTLAASGYLLF